MARSKKPGAKRGSPEWVERVREGRRRSNALRRRRAKIGSKALERFSREGIVEPSLAPIVKLAQAELAEWIEAFGGPETVTPQTRAILEDTATLGVVLRGELGRYLQTRDPDAASKATTAANARRTSLVAVGLGRFEQEVDLASYLAQHETHKTAGSAIYGRDDEEGDQAQEETE